MNYSPMDLARLLISYARSLEVESKPVSLPADCVQDLRGRPREGRGKARELRPWSKVVGICWHQTASGHLDADHPGLLSIPAHILLHRDGTWSWLHPFERVVWHGHALNGGTIGIEVDARAAGVEGDPRTFWLGHSGKTYPELVREATREQLLAIPGLMKFCIETVAANGGEVKANWAHRQGHSSRTTDPGSRIWRAVKAADPLKDVQDMKLGSGKVIPKEWR